MAPAPKVDDFIVSLFTNQGDPWPQKLIKPLFHCLQISGTPGPKSWSNHCSIVYWQKSRQPPAQKVDEIIVPLFIVPVEKSQIIDNQSLKLKQQ